MYIAPGLRLVDSGEIPEQLLNGVKGLADVYTQLLQPEKELDWVFLSPSASLVPGATDDQQAVDLCFLYSLKDGAVTA